MKDVTDDGYAGNKLFTEHCPELRRILDTFETVLSSYDGSKRPQERTPQTYHRDSFKKSQ